MSTVKRNLHRVDDRFKVVFNEGKFWELVRLWFEVFSTVGPLLQFTLTSIRTSLPSSPPEPQSFGPKSESGSEQPNRCDCQCSRRDGGTNGTGITLTFRTPNYTPKFLTELPSVGRREWQKDWYGFDPRRLVQSVERWNETWNGNWLKVTKSS